jgi:prepilin-type N-terminal cleavage/methylation domain-containing protein
MIIRPSKNKYAQGFSLVELMVALVIGLLIMLGATQLFITGKQTFNHAEKLGKRQETLRYLVDVISQDIRMADPLSEALVETAGEINLYYELTRTNDPYCAGGDSSDLARLRYYQNGSSLKVEVFCGDPATSVSDEAIVSGIEGATFDLSIDPIENSNFKVYVDVIFSLEPIDGVPDDILFRVTNRASAVARLD